MGTSFDPQTRAAGRSLGCPSGPSFRRAEAWNRQPCGAMAPFLGHLLPLLTLLELLPSLTSQPACRSQEPPGGPRPSHSAPGEATLPTGPPPAAPRCDRVPESQCKGKEGPSFVFLSCRMGPRCLWAATPEHQRLDGSNNKK